MESKPNYNYDSNLDDDFEIPSKNTKKKSSKVVHRKKKKCQYLKVHKVDSN